MKGSYYVFGLLACLGVVSNSYSETPAQPVKKDCVKRSTTIEVKQKDPVFKLELKANHTTGYRWFLGQIDEHLIEPIKQVYQPDDGELMGSGGKEVWTFKVNPKAFAFPKVMTVEMIYARPWALEETARTKTFRIVTYP